jgi:hypothetical protein
MIQDTQEYLQQWEKENNPFYPSEMRWDRLQVNRFLKDYKQQLTLTDVGWSEVFIKYGKPFTSGRDLWDWLKDNCKVVLKT